VGAACAGAAAGSAFFELVFLCGGGAFVSGAEGFLSASLEIPVQVLPEPLIDATLKLLDAADAEGEDFPQLRAGAAVGAALPRAGDWFGRPVNLASRITAIARPGSLLVERDLRDSALDSYSWSYAGERRLRGVREPVTLFRARRLAV